jgi:hypothetical protein
MPVNMLVPSSVATPIIWRQIILQISLRRQLAEYTYICLCLCEAASVV